MEWKYIYLNHLTQYFVKINIYISETPQLSEIIKQYNKKQRMKNLSEMICYLKFKIYVSEILYEKESTF